MSDLIGKDLGQYRIVEQIGRGGMATVFRATQTSMGREVAVKVLPREFMHDDTFMQRFMREVKVIAGLQHVHILPVHDFGEYQGLPYIVMAYIQGGTLSDRIRQGPMPLAEVQRLVRQMAGALDYAHSKNIIHRDFKPSNVLLDEQGNTYLADFGIAKATESTIQLTGTGAMVGTPSYMAPELVEKGDLTSAVDVYALGITAYEMLTGRVPYHSETPIKTLMEHINMPVPDVRAERPDLPEGVRQFINTAMAKKPATRYATPSGLADGLDTAAQGAKMPAPAADTEAMTVGMPPPATPTQTGSPTRPSEPTEHRERRKGAGPLTIVGGLLVALGIIAAVVVGGVLLLGNAGGGVGAAIEVPAVVAVVVSSTPDPALAAPTEIPATLTPSITATPAPAISDVIFCDSPCLPDGSNQAVVFGEAVPRIYVLWEYDGMQQGMSYTREWYNNGEFWLRYDCIWQGSESGSFSVTLRETNGLRSGTWTMIITIEGVEAVRSNVTVAGDFDFWDPAGVLPCEDF